MFSSSGSLYVCMYVCMYVHTQKRKTQQQQQQDEACVYFFGIINQSTILIKKIQINRARIDKQKENDVSRYAFTYIHTYIHIAVGLHIHTYILM